jgi:hypothetical protein
MQPTPLHLGDIMPDLSSSEMPSLQPMSMAPRDREIIVTDRDGDQVVAQCSVDGEYAVGEPATAGGYWRTEAGFITPEEALGWHTFNDASGALRR